MEPVNELDSNHVPNQYEYQTREGKRTFDALVTLGYGGSDVRIEDLADLAALSSEIDRCIVHTADALRTNDVSWAKIGSALGISRQGAHERFSKSP